MIERGQDGLVRDLQQTCAFVGSKFIVHRNGAHCSGVQPGFQVAATSRFLRRLRTNARRRLFTTCRSIFDQKATK